MQAVRAVGKEIRAYAATMATMLVALEATGTLDRLWPEPDPPELEDVADDLDPSVRDALGRVIVDPIDLDLDDPLLDIRPDIPKVQIGDAIVLECPFEDGCVEATDQPLSIGPGLIIADPDGIDLSFVSDDPLVDDVGLGLLALIIVATLTGTLAAKRVWARLRHEE